MFGKFGDYLFGLLTTVIGLFKNQKYQPKIFGEKQRPQFNQSYADRFRFPTNDPERYIKVMEYCDKKVVKNKLSRGCKLFHINDEIILALNEKNAIRKYDLKYGNI